MKSEEEGEGWGLFPFGIRCLEHVIFDCLAGVIPEMQYLMTRDKARVWEK